MEVILKISIALWFIFSFSILLFILTDIKEKPWVETLCVDMKPKHPDEENEHVK